MKHRHKPLTQRLRELGIYLLGFAMLLLGVDIVWIVVFGGVRLDFGYFVLRSTTIEFPTITWVISLFCFLLLRGQWKESILLAGSLAVGCVIGEGMFRIVDHPWSKPFIDANAWQEPSDVLGFTMAPNFEGRGPLDVWVKTNSQGFRDDGEHPWTKPPGVIRILGLGDSFTFGWGVTLEESFLKNLERTIHSRTGRNIETINAGVPGWGLNHYYVYYKEIGVRYSPDVIVLSYFWNDITDSIQETLPPDQMHQKGWKRRGGIFHFSYLFNFVKSLGHYIRNKNKFKRIDYMYELHPRRQEFAKLKNTLLFDPGQEQTRASSHIIKTLLKKIQILASRHGSQLIVMFVPDVAQLQHPDMQFLNGVLASITEELGIPFVDLTPIFESASDPRTFYYWPKDFHTNPYGHQKMAGALTPLVCQALQQKNIECATSMGQAKDLPRR